MHPILDRRQRLLPYFLAIVLGAVGLMLMLRMSGRATWSGAAIIAYPMAALFGAVCLSALYVCRASPLRHASPGRTVAVLVSASLMSAAFEVGAGYLLAAALEWLLPHAGIGAAFARVSPWLFAFGALLFLMACLLSYLLIELEQSQMAERRAWELKVHAAEAELKALRAQVDPHFLFNSLNSVGALITAEPAAARRMCILLGEFLRGSLSVRNARIPLSREVGLVQQYLTIEKVRFADRLRFSIDLAPEARDVLVPPLILQPLVENAITHGVAGLLEGGEIRIRCTRHGATARVVVENPVEPVRRASPGMGLGLANVRGRLAAEFGRDALLSLQDGGTTFTVVLTLPTDPVAAAIATPAAVAQ